MGIVGGTGSGRRVLAEIRLFLFCYDLSHFASLHPHNKKTFLKFKTQGGGRKRQERRGPKLHSSRVSSLGVLTL